jgi:hypothetical protein
MHPPVEDSMSAAHNFPAVPIRRTVHAAVVEMLCEGYEGCVLGRYRVCPPS